MTYKDYFVWAEEYRLQIGVLNEKIQKRLAVRKEMSVNSYDNEMILASLYEMRRECESTYRILRSKAEDIMRQEA